jgi:DNA-directed RNA polymerase subunit RPC12/RpoP
LLYDTQNADCESEMTSEFVTDRVLVPGLRCPHCGSKVRAIRVSPLMKHDLISALIEPIIWVLGAIAGLLGYLLEVTIFASIMFIVLVPVAAIGLYLQSLRNGTFLCNSCNAELSYRDVSEINKTDKYSMKWQVIGVLFGFAIGGILGWISGTANGILYGIIWGGFTGEFIGMLIGYLRSDDW